MFRCWRSGQNDNTSGTSFDEPKGQCYLEGLKGQGLELRRFGFEAESGLGEEPVDEGSKLDPGRVPLGGDRGLVALGSPVRRDLRVNPIRCSR